MSQPERPAAISMTRCAGFELSVEPVECLDELRPSTCQVPPAPHKRVKPQPIEQPRDQWVLVVAIAEACGPDVPTLCRKQERLVSDVANGVRRLGCFKLNAIEVHLVHEVAGKAFDMLAQGLAGCWLDLYEAQRG